MKKHYTIILLLALIQFGCSKDFLKPYEERIEGGTWELHDIDRQGIGGGYDPRFTGGRFQFFSGGELEYTDQAGNFYEGSWNMRKYNGGPDGDRVRSLTITAIDFTNNRVLTESFDDMQFSGTDRFRAFVYTGNRTYVFRFKR
jgi:hypothetical protein